MFYLYGVVRAGQPAPERVGVGSPPQAVEVVNGAGLGALVSKLPDGYQVHEEDARSHLNVLIAALRDGPVVPLRMGTVADDVTEVGRLLSDAGSELVAALETLDGLVELQVDADDDVAQVVALVARTAPVVDSRGADLATQIEVGQHVAELVTEHRIRVAEQIVDRLRRLSVDDVPRSQISGPEDPVLRWAFLVRRDDVELFDEAMIALRAEYPSLTFRYVGPLPAAHFVDREPAGTTPPADTFRGNGAWGW